MKKALGLLLLLVMLSPVLVLFQNCGEGFSPIRPKNLGSVFNDDDNFEPLSITFQPSVDVLQGQNVIIRYQLDHVSQAPVTVSVQVKGGTAIAGTDYVVPEATFTVPAGTLDGVYIFATKSFEPKDTASNVQLEFSSNRATITSAETNVNIAPTPGPGFYRDLQLPAAVKDIFSGFYHNCAILVDDRIYCWGFSVESQLGDGVDVPTTGAPSPPIAMGSVPGALYGVAGQYFNCVLNTAGEVYCWGIGPVVGERLDGNYFTPAKVTLPSKALQIASGGYDLCVLLEGGNVYCWGQSIIQLGQVVTRDPQLIATSAKKIAMSAFQLCYIDDMGGVRCGDISLVSTGTPFSPIGSQRFPSVDIKIYGINSGARVGCSKSELGQWQCWGPNMLAGDPTYNNMTDFFPEGWYSSVCAATPEALKCWGTNTRGQLGNGQPLAATLPAQNAVNSLYRVGLIKYSASGFIGCVLTISGVKCSGF